MSTNTELDRLWEQAEANPGTPVPVGDIVVCDFCGQDYTQSDALGGLIFGSYAICEKCSPKVANESSRIRARCPAGKSFADFVREYRGPNSAITVTPVAKPTAPLCCSCKQEFTSANVFTQAGWAETRISGMCEKCWDEAFAEEDE
jgi:hypothetical protein